jgi:hypothetical protein
MIGLLVEKAVGPYSSVSSLAPEEGQQVFVDLILMRRREPAAFTGSVEYTISTFGPFK